MTGTSRSRRTLAATLLAGALAQPLLAERVFTGTGLARREAQPGALSAQAIQERVGFDQKLGANVPLDLAFRDETGRDVRLGDYFGKKPVLLALVYFRCPVLCTQVSTGVAASLKGVPYAPGDDFDVLFVSFDPTDDAATASEKKQAILARYGHPERAAGFHFLTGELTSIAALTDAVGFRYAYDETNRQFAHAAGVVALTADGRVSRYLYGVEYAPKDVKLALFEAGEGKIGGLAEKLLLLCFNYDAALGKYTAATMLSLKVVATLTLLAMGGAIFGMLRSERRKHRRPDRADAPVEGAASV